MTLSYLLPFRRFCPSHQCVTQHIHLLYGGVACIECSNHQATNLQVETVASKTVIEGATLLGGYND